MLQYNAVCLCLGERSKSRSRSSGVSTFGAVAQGAHMRTTLHHVHTVHSELVELLSFLQQLRRGSKRIQQVYTVCTDHMTILIVDCGTDT